MVVLQVGSVYYMQDLIVSLDGSLTSLMVTVQFRIVSYMLQTR